MSARVVILGCGFGGLWAAQGLRKAPVELTVVDRTNHHLFTPLLYQVATAGLAAPEISGPIRHILAGQRNVTVLMGEARSVDVARRGWLVKMGQKMYALTREGRQVVRRGLLEEEEEQPGTNIKLSRDMEKFVLGLLDSSAVQKFDENRKSDLTFMDACRFWGIAESMKGEAIEARIQQVQTYLAELDRSLADVDAELSTTDDLVRRVKPLGRGADQGEVLRILERNVLRRRLLARNFRQGAI